MRKNAFAQGSWYKGNTHTHTTASDGTIKQEEVVRIYRERGYDFLALTEHNTYTDTEKYDTDNFITIPGAEPMLWHNSRETAFTAHVVCIGIPGKLSAVKGSAKPILKRLFGAEKEYGPWPRTTCTAFTV